MNSKNDQELRDIQIARIAFIGATIATIGDGITAYAAGLALNALENPQSNQTRSTSSPIDEDTKAQIDYYINELVQIRNYIS